MDMGMGTKVSFFPRFPLLAGRHVLSIRPFAAPLCPSSGRQSHDRLAWGPSGSALLRWPSSLAGWLGRACWACFLPWRALEWEMKPFRDADEAAIDGQRWTLRHQRRGLTSSVARWWMGVQIMNSNHQGMARCSQRIFV